MIEHFRVLGKNGQDDLCPIGIGYGVQRIVGIAAMLDVGQLWMHILWGYDKEKSALVAEVSARGNPPQGKSERGLRDLFFRNEK